MTRIGRPTPSSPEASRRMAATRGTNNRVDRLLRSALHRRGLRFRIQQKLIPGSKRTVDIVFSRARLAIFVDGCFWHACPIHCSQPKSNAEWWARKIWQNVERDHDTNERLRALGWRVLRIWEHEDPTEAASRVVDAYRESVR
jgi:DNA mismatch endonuclease, patch repair protein